MSDNLRKIKLITVTEDIDEIGQVAYLEESKEVFATVTSATRNEWTSAGKLDINPDYRVVIYSFEYSGQTIVEMDSVRYSVYRTYEVSRDRIELYLEKQSGVTYGE